jgi:tetratricopeptide (TPR) repeat protein
MDDRRFEYACQLKEDGKFTESFKEFVRLAGDTEEPTDKAAAFLYAAASLKMAGQFEPARQQLNEVKAILATSSIQGSKDIFPVERTQWLELAVAFEEADTYRAESRTEEALARFQDLLSRFAVQVRQPSYRADYEMIQTRRAFLLADLGRWGDALSLLEEAESFEQTEGSINFYQGYCYVAIGNNAKGEQKLRKSLEMGLPPYLEYRAHCALGKAYHKLEDYTRAKAELEKGAQTADPAYIRQAQLWKWLEVTCLHLGLKDEAEHYARLARPS